MNHRKLCVDRGKPNARKAVHSPLVEDVRPAKFSSMKDLVAYYEKSITGKYIVKAAEKMGLEPKDLGKNPEEICEGIERASLKLLRSDKGYKSPEHAVASLVVARNESDNAVAILGRMISAVENGETSNELKNMIEVIREAKSIGFKTGMGSDSELVSDEILRISTHRNYRSSKGGIAVLVLSQKPDGADVVMSEIVPKLSGSEVYDLRGFVRNRIEKGKIVKGDYLLNTLEKRIEKDIERITGTAA